MITEPSQAPGPLRSTGHRQVGPSSPVSEATPLVLRTTYALGSLGSRYTDIMSHPLWKAGYFYAVLGLCHFALCLLGLELVRVSCGWASSTSLAANFQAVLRADAKTQDRVRVAGFAGLVLLLFMALSRIVVSQLLLGRLFPLLRPSSASPPMPMLRCSFNTLLTLWSTCDVLQMVMPHTSIQVVGGQACASEALFTQLALLLLGLAHVPLLLCLKGDREANVLFVVVTAAILLLGIANDLLLRFELVWGFHDVEWVKVMKRSVLMVCVGLAMPQCLLLRSVTKLHVCRVEQNQAAAAAAAAARVAGVGNETFGSGSRGGPMTRTVTSSHPSSLPARFASSP